MRLAPWLLVALAATSVAAHVTGTHEGAAYDSEHDVLYLWTTDGIFLLPSPADVPDRSLAIPSSLTPIRAEDRALVAPQGGLGVVLRPDPSQRRWEAEFLDLGDAAVVPPPITGLRFLLGAKGRTVAVGDPVSDPEGLVGDLRWRIFGERGAPMGLTTEVPKATGAALDGRGVVFVESDKAEIVMTRGRITRETVEGEFRDVAVSDAAEIVMFVHRRHQDRVTVVETAPDPNVEHVVRVDGRVRSIAVSPDGRHGVAWLDNGAFQRIDVPGGGVDAEVDLPHVLCPGLDGRVTSMWLDDAGVSTLVITSEDDDPHAAIRILQVRMDSPSGIPSVIGMAGLPASSAGTRVPRLLDVARRSVWVDLEPTPRRVTAAPTNLCPDLPAFAAGPAGLPVNATTQFSIASIVATWGHWPVDLDSGEERRISATIEFVCTTSGGTCSDRPMLHQGFDLLADPNDTGVTEDAITSTVEGIVEVIEAVSDGDLFEAATNYGATVEVVDGSVEHKFSHLDDLHVETYDTVVRGDTLGYVVEWPCSTNHHVHYAIKENVDGVDQALNPIAYTGPYDDSRPPTVASVEVCDPDTDATSPDWTCHGTSSTVCPQIDDDFDVVATRLIDLYDHSEDGATTHVLGPASFRASVCDEGGTCVEKSPVDLGSGIPWSWTSATGWETAHMVYSRKPTYESVPDYCTADVFHGIPSNMRSDEPHWEGYFDLGEFSDGFHTVKVEGTDFMGNTFLASRGICIVRTSRKACRPKIVVRDCETDFGGEAAFCDPWVGSPDVSYLGEGTIRVCVYNGGCDTFLDDTVLQVWAGLSYPYFVKPTTVMSSPSLVWMTGEDYLPEVLVERKVRLWQRKPGGWFKGTGPAFGWSPGRSKCFDIPLVPFFESRELPEWGPFGPLFDPAIRIAVGGDGDEPRFDLDPHEDNNQTWILMTEEIVDDLRSILEGKGTE